jgi:microcystin-dependent protein
MASNVDKYVTDVEHASIDHTGIPGVGGGGGVIAEEWEAFTPTGSWTGNVAYTGQFKRISDTAIVRVRVEATSASPTPAVTLTIDPIPGTTVDVSKALFGSPGAPTIGYGRVWNNGVALAAQTLQVIYNAGAFEVQWHSSVAGGAVSALTPVDPASPFTFDTDDSCFVEFTYPVTEWAGSTGVSGIGSDTLPTGTIVPYGGTAAAVPSGFLPCDGSLYDVTVEAELFAAIGLAWNTGGEPGGFFRVPDLRGKGVLGLNDGTLPAGADGGLTTRTLASTGGEEAHALSSAELASHQHTLTNFQAQVNATSQALDGGGNGSNILTSGTNSFSRTIQLETVVGTTANTGSGSAHNNMQPFAVCSYIIKSQQLGGGIGITVQNNGGPLTGTQPSLNFIPSGIAGVTVVEDGGNSRTDVTISATESFDASAHDAHDHTGVAGIDPNRLAKREISATSAISANHGAATIQPPTALPTTTTGAQVDSISYSPVRVGNLVKVTAVVCYGINNARDTCVSLFQGTTNIGASGVRGNGGGAGLHSQTCVGEFTVSSLASVTISSRIALDATTGSLYVNGTNTGTVAYGAANKSWLIIEEYDPS